MTTNEEIIEKIEVDFRDKNGISHLEKHYREYPNESIKELIKKALAMKDGQRTDEILELIEKEWTICGDKECKPCKSFEKIHQKITAMGKGEK